MKNIKSFDEFWKEYCKEAEFDPWNSSLEEYNYHKRIAMKMYQAMLNK